MTELVTVRPARPGMHIVVPERGYTAMSGPTPVNPEDPYWMRLIADGDVVRVDAPRKAGASAKKEI